MAPGRVAVLGAGVSGLAAAHALSGRFAVTVLEASGRIGGKIGTGRIAGRAVDLGPDAFIARNPAGRRLAEELGLGALLVSPAAGRAAVFSSGAVHPFPSGLVLGIPTDLRALARSRCVPARHVLRCGLDLVDPRVVLRRDGTRETSDDPSVAEVLRPRLGGGVFDALVDPLLSGINAGDSRRLSFAAAAPSLVPALAGRRSVLRALRDGARERRPSEPVFYGLRGGLGQLVESLGDRLEKDGVAVVRNAPVHALSAPSGATPWRVHAGQDVLEADAVVAALPSFCLAPLVAPLGEGLARACAAIPFAGVVTVAFAFNGGAFDPGPGLAGVLVSRREGKLATAVTFTSSKWPDEGSELVVRVSAGHFGDARALALSDDELVSALRAELSEIVGIAASPIETRIERFPSSFPQYTPGHRRRVEGIERAAAGLPAFTVCGASYHGIGIPACIESGERAAAAVAAALAP